MYTRGFFVLIMIATLTIAITTDTIKENTNSLYEKKKAICKSECDGMYNQCLSTGFVSIEDINGCKISKSNCKFDCHIENKTNWLKRNRHRKLSKFEKQREHDNFLQNIAWSNCNDFYKPCVSFLYRIQNGTKDCLSMATHMCYKAVRFVLHGKEKEERKGLPKGDQII